MNSGLVQKKYNPYRSDLFDEIGIGVSDEAADYVTVSIDLRYQGKSLSTAGPLPYRLSFVAYLSGDPDGLGYLGVPPLDIIPQGDGDLLWPGSYPEFRLVTDLFGTCEFKVYDTGDFEAYLVIIALDGSLIVSDPITLTA